MFCVSFIRSWIKALKSQACYNRLSKRKLILLCLVIHFIKRLLVNFPKAINKLLSNLILMVIIQKLLPKEQNRQPENRFGL